MNYSGKITVSLFEVRLSRGLLWYLHDLSVALFNELEDGSSTVYNPGTV